MSNFYLDIVKDLLYCEKTDSAVRRGIQTVLYRVLDDLVRLTAPVLAFTSEEIWAHMPHGKGAETKSPLLAGMKREDNLKTVRTPDYIDTVFTVRPDVNKALEAARGEKLIGKSLEAAITLTVTPDMYAQLEPRKNELNALFIVSSTTLISGDSFDVAVSKAPGGKCERCWGYFEDLGADPSHPALCPRCTGVVS